MTNHSEFQKVYLRLINLNPQIQWLKDEMDEEFLQIDKSDISTSEKIKEKASLILLCAAKFNYHELIQPLKNLGANPNYQDNFKKNGTDNTPLIWSIANGNFEFAKEFLEEFGKKIDLKIKGSFKPDKGPAMTNNALHLTLLKGYENQDSEGRKFENNNCSYLDLTKKMFELDRALINELNYPAEFKPLDIACLRRDNKILQIFIDNKFTFLRQDIEFANECFNRDIKRVKAIFATNSYLYYLDEDKFVNSENLEKCKEALESLDRSKIIEIDQTNEAGVKNPSGQQITKIIKSSVID